MVGREVVETASALVALLAALLVVGRYRTSARLRDLVLVQGFVVLAVANLLPNVLPALAVDEGASADVLRTRLFVVGGVLAAGSLALAAIAGDARLARRQVSPVLAAASGLITPALAILLLDHLRLQPTQVGTARVLHGLAGALYALAALGFSHRPRTDGGRLHAFLAVGCLLASSGRLALVVAPSAVIADTTHPADLLRLCFYGVLLAGAVDEIRSYWQRVAVLEERRRLARDLHDGVAQELAFIATEAARRNPRPDQVQRIGAAAQRALDESRRAISALSRPLDQPLEEAVAEAASEVVLRAGTMLRLDLARGITVAASAREELVRILREALTNATHHGRATTVQVELRRSHDLLTLRIVDDGIGFALGSTPPPGHIGLTTMRERAEHLGAQLVLTSTPGAGTEVEVRLPCPA
jgi:signal transduction histidine kinase